MSDTGIAHAELMQKNYVKRVVLFILMTP